MRYGEVPGDELIRGKRRVCMEDEEEIGAPLKRKLGTMRYWAFPDSMGARIFTIWRTSGLDIVRRRTISADQVSIPDKRRCSKFPCIGPLCKWGMKVVLSSLPFGGSGIDFFYIQRRLVLYYRRKRPIRPDCISLE